MEDNKRLDKLERQNKEAFYRSVDQEFIKLWVKKSGSINTSKIMTNSFFVTEFNKRQRDLLWDDQSTEMKKWFRLLLSQLKFTDLEYDGEIPEKFYSQDFYRLQLGYYGIGKGSGINISSTAKPDTKNNKKVLAGLMGIFFGGFGIHKFVLGYKKPGLIMLIGSLVTFGLLFYVFAVIGLIEGIIYLTKSDDNFYATYQEGRKHWF